MDSIHSSTPQPNRRACSPACSAYCPPPTAHSHLYLSPAFSFLLPEDPMQLHQATSVISASSSSVMSSQGDVQRSHAISPEFLRCPNCGKKTVRIVSHSPNNPDRVFMKCKSNTSLKSQDVSDEIRWIRGNNKFATRSVYTFVTDVPVVSSNIGKIWKIKAPPRVRVFAWLLLSFILTTGNLMKKGWQILSTIVEVILKLCSTCSPSASL